MDNDELADKFDELIELVKKLKPNDRSEADRRFAILLTDLEKLQAYRAYYC